MTKEQDATRARLESIKAAVQSISTCTQATVAELQALLSSEASQKENLRTKSTRATAAQSAARRRPGTATGTRANDATGSTLLPRDRYVLATGTANATLKSLADALKPRTTPPPKSKSPTNVGTDAQSPRGVRSGPSKSSSISQQPLRERSASQVNNSPTKPKSLRRSSSHSNLTGPDARLVATAECARAAFAYLSTPEAIKIAGKGAPELALENGRLSLIGKLVAHGLDNLAVKEMRILKKRLDKYLGRNTETEHSRPGTSRSTSQAVSSTEKENLASLLDCGDVDYESAAIPIIFNLQIYVLRVIARVKRPRIVETAWNYLKLSHPSNPATLISHTAKEKDNRAKASRQLESLAQAILHLCPSISTSADEEPLQPSPDIVLCLQHLAFGIRERWWALARHRGDREKELIEPFGKCLATFARRSRLPAAKKYKIAEFLFSNLLGAGNNTNYLERDGKALLGAKNATLASLARAAELPDEALRWLDTSSSTSDESAAADAIRLVRIAAISLETCLKKGLATNDEVPVNTALEALSGSLDGTTKELETLLAEVHTLRRVATAIILSSLSGAEPLPSSLLQHQCIDIVAASIRFSIRFVGRQPSHDSPPTTMASHQAHSSMVSQLLKRIVDSVVACCRLPLMSDATWIELDTLIQHCVRLILQLEADPVGDSSPSRTTQEAGQSFFVKLSNTYWSLHRQLWKLDSKSVPALTAMQRSTELLRSRPQMDREAGQLASKLERLGEALSELDHVQESRTAFRQCIQISLDDGLATIIPEETSNRDVEHIFRSSPQLSDLGRVLKLHSRSFARYGLGHPDELAFFDDSKYTAAVRGALLEWQLAAYQQILARHRTWDAALDASIRTMVDRLLSLYAPAHFPIRRQRVLLLLLQLSQSYSEIIPGTYILPEVESNNDILKTYDRNLARFGDHLSAMLILKRALQNGDLVNERVRRCFSIWQTMVDSAGSWDEVAKRIDNADHWLEAIQASVDFLCAKGEEYEALRVLHLLVRILELQRNPDPSSLIITLCTMGVQFLRLGYSGKAGLAFAKAEIISSSKAASTEAKLRWHLGYAEYLLHIGNVTKCESTLSAAEILAQNDARFMDLSKSSTALSGRVVFNTVLAEACYVSSLLCSSKGDHKNSARYARQCVHLIRRVWAAIEGTINTRKAATVCHNKTNSGVSPGSSSIALSSLRDEKGTPLISSVTHDALAGPDFWSLVPSLYRALTQHSNVIASQGFLHEAVYVLEAAQKVASAIGSSTLLMDIASRLADFWIQSGRPDKAQPLLDSVDVSPCARHLNAVTYHSSVARMHHASHEFEKEVAVYDNMEKLISDLSSRSTLASFGSFTSVVDALVKGVSSMNLEEPDSGEVKRTRATRTRATATKAAPRIAAKATSRPTRKAPLKSAPKTVARVSKKAEPLPVNEQHSVSEQCTLLEMFCADITYRRIASYLLQGEVAKATDVLARIEPMQKDRDGSHAWVHFKALLAQAIKSISEDFTFNTLPESTIAFPSIPQKERLSSEGAATKRPVVKSSTRNARGKEQAGHDFVALIQIARENLVEAHARHASAASNHVFRQLSAALSHATILLSAVSQGRIRGSIHPLYSAYMSEIPKHYALALAHDSVEVDQETMSREEYLQWPKPTSTRPPLASPADFQHDYIDIIPETWAAVSLALSEEQDEIYITRYQKGVSPFVLRLPLARHSSRDLDEEEFSFADGKREFEEIMELSDFTLRGAKNLTSREDKKQWWEDREALDTKLRELLINIENIWLGGFKGIFSDHLHQPSLLARFRKSFDNILNRHLPSRRKKEQQKKPNLDPRVLELFIGLGDASNAELDLDEALMDLIYFVVDILQFNGEPNAYDEIDFDAMVIETHDALRAYHSSSQNVLPGTAHTILILDKNLHALPWESLPCLEKLSISRLPSLAALRERLLTARSPTAVQDAQAGHYISAHAGGTSMLNPSGDLSHTSKTIKPCLDDMHGPWTHIADRAPSEKEFEHSLKNDQLVLYVGHGNGEQYIRSKVVRRLYLNDRKPGCATTFLFGCSSVHLSENGIYEPSGMLASYLTAGAPAVLGMLWDVTDKDCDRFTVRVGELWGLWSEAEEASVEAPPTVRKKKGKGRVAQLAEEVETPRRVGRARRREEGGEGARSGGRRRRGVGLDEAVREARGACVLRYLNGAAAVVYGIPVFLE